jgi:radical SAM protein with 4Fe4S-binding SPASM domain
MACTQTEWLGNREYLQQFNRKVAKRRIPLSGSLALTHRCNLRCVHCYLGPLEAADAMHDSEMTTDQVVSVIDQVTEAGCLYLLITGGEPLLRKDFAAIYSHARTNGMVVTVFTNGTLITDQTLELFEDLPPRAVDITVYGATPATYEKITGVKGSYQRCLSNIEELIQRGVNVTLKTMLMTLNRHEFFDIKAMAREYGCQFRFDAALFPRLDGDKELLELRVSPGEVVAKEFANGDTASKWRELYDRLGKVRPSDLLYRCGAGRTTFHIDPYGALQPCLMATDRAYNLLEGRFSVGWGQPIRTYTERRADPGYPCGACHKRVLCGLCPPLSRLETGRESGVSEYLCTIGQLRWEAINGSGER